MRRCPVLSLSADMYTVSSAYHPVAVGGKGGGGGGRGGGPMEEVRGESQNQWE